MREYLDDGNFIYGICQRKYLWYPQIDFFSTIKYSFNAFEANIYLVGI